MNNTQPTQQSTTIPQIPNGFTIGTAPNGQQYLVPQFMVPALDQAFAAYQTKLEFGVLNEQGGSSQSEERPFVELGEGLLLFPPDPPLSDQEHLSLHAEVIALQQRLGISYKDASHRLYMAELEKLKVADAAHKAFKNLDKRIGKYLADLNTRFGQARSDADADADSL